MNKQYILFAHKREWDEVCLGHAVDHTGSEVTLCVTSSRDEVISFIRKLEQPRLHRDESPWEFELLINGEGILVEDFAGSPQVREPEDKAAYLEERENIYSLARNQGN